MENKRKLIFFAITALIPVIAFVLLEIALRLLSYGDDVTLFVESSEPGYLRCNPKAGKRFFNAVEYTTPLNDLFLKEKPSNGYRIFVLGESTVLGFPYDANVAFTRILQRRLQDIFPNRVIEVVNLGLTAVTTYTLLDFSDELLQQHPDAVLIYAGHNEYYGALGVASMEKGSIPSWLKKFQLGLIHLRTYQLLQSFIGNIYQFFAPLNAEEAKGTLMQRLVGKNLIPYGSPMYHEGLMQFNDNMSRLLLKMNKAGVPVVMSDLVSNVKDLPPFRSSPYENYSEAESLYAGAKRLESLAQYEKAKEGYIKAKDFDLIRFRASEDLNKSIVHLADSFNVHFVSLKSLFEEHSPRGIVGDNLMTEHLHPNIDGYFLMAEGFLKALKQYGMIEKNWDSTSIKPWTYYRSNWGFTALDSMIAVLRIKHLKSGWPFQPETTVNNFLFTYTPHGVVDSLAFMSVKYDNVSSERAHKQLAEYYKSNGDFESASKEYLSIAYASPSYAAAYYYAAEYAALARDYNHAIRWMKQSPNPDTSAYAQFTLATYYYSNKEFKAALARIQKAEGLRQDANNYYQIQKLKYQVVKDSGLAEEEKKVLALLKQLNPEFQKESRAPGVTILIPHSIKSYIERAELLRKRGQLSEALAVLKEANKVQEIAYTNLLMGKILFTQKKTEALLYFEKAQKEIKNDPSLSFGLCALYLMNGNLPKAKIALHDFARLQGEDDPQVKLLRARLEEETKKMRGGHQK